MKKYLLLITAMITTLLVSGCGGGGGKSTNTPTINSITVSESTQRIALGYKVTLVTTAHMTDSTSQVVTDGVVYTSSNTEVLVADTNTPNTFNPLRTGEATISASYSGYEDSTTITVTDAVLLSINISDSTLDVPKGKTLQAIATGNYSDNTSVNISNSINWSSTNTATATIDSNGILLAKATGSTNISASSNDIESNSIEITVSQAILNALNLTIDKTQIYPSNTATYTLKGTMSDDTPIDINNTDASWVSSDESIATVSATGVLTAVSTGEVTITVTRSNISAEHAVTITPEYLASIAVTGANTAQEALTTTLVATGTYNNETTQDITSSVTWVSSDTSVATVSDTGMIQGLHEGSTIITASNNNISTTFNITVEKLAISAISISSPPSSLEDKSSTQLTAQGTYGNDETSINITQYATWTSSNTDIATVSTGGLLTAISEGSVDIQVSYNGKTSSTHTINITPYKWINKISSYSMGKSSSCVNGYCTLAYTLSVSNNSLANIKLLEVKIYSPTNLNSPIKTLSADIDISSKSSTSFSTGSFRGGRENTFIYKLKNLDTNEILYFTLPSA